MTLVAGSQLTLDFQPGLVERHRSLHACVRQCAYSHRNPLKAIAADMDLSQSELSRKLSDNDDDPRRLSVDDLEKFIEATGDTTPILYLIEKFLADQETKQRAAAQSLMKMLPDLVALIQTAQGKGDR